MSKKQMLRVTVNVLMTAALLLLMSYSLLGEAAHEWVGVGIFVLFVIHHVLNGRWCQDLLKGRYTPFRILQTALVLLTALCMAGSMTSGVVLSRHVFGLDIRSFSSAAQTVHMLSACWGFALMSLHLGLHWSMMMGMARKLVKKASERRKCVFGKIESEQKGSKS